MEDAALSRLKRALSSGLESLPNGISGHRTFSYGESEYLVRPLVADPATIARLTILDRADYHLPEIVTLANGAYEVQRHLPNPPLATVPLRTPEEMHATYERVWNAIGACHEAGVGHGDIHPGNILYQGDQIAIIDWEWARACDEPSRAPRLDLAHFDYAGLAYTGRALFMNHPDVGRIFPQYRGSDQMNREALERTVVRISEDLKLPRFV